MQGSRKRVGGQEEACRGAGGSVWGTQRLAGPRFPREASSPILACRQVQLCLKLGEACSGQEEACGRQQSWADPHLTREASSPVSYDGVSSNFYKGLRGDPTGVPVGTHFSCGEVAPNITEVPAGVACGCPQSRDLQRPFSDLAGFLPISTGFPAVCAGEACRDPQFLQRSSGTPFSPSEGSYPISQGSPQGKCAGAPQILHWSAGTHFNPGWDPSNFTMVVLAGEACRSPKFYRGPLGPFSTLAGFPPISSWVPTGEACSGLPMFTGVARDPCQPLLSSLQLLQGSLWGPLSAMERYPPTSQGSRRGKRVGSPRFYRGPQGPFSALAGFPPVFTGGPHGGSVYESPSFCRGPQPWLDFLQFLQVSPRGNRVGIPQVLQESPALAWFPPIFHRDPRGRLLSCGEVLSNFEKVSVGEACGGPLDVCSKVLSHTALAQGGSCSCVICPGSSQ